MKLDIEQSSESSWEEQWTISNGGSREEFYARADKKIEITQCKLCGKDFHSNKKRDRGYCNDCWADAPQECMA